MNKLRQRMREDGLRSLPGRALRWFRWKVLAARRRARAARALANHVPPPVCHDIRGWCEADPEATYRVTAEAQRIVRPPPHTIEPEMHPVFDPYYEVDAPEQALVGLGGASVAPNGLVFLPDGSVAGETVTHLPEDQRLLLAEQPAYNRPLPTTVRQLAGNYYSLMFSNYDNYYHWHHDVVMRLPAVLPHLPPDSRFIVPPALNDLAYARDMLTVVGLDPAKLRFFPGEEVWTCERLYFSVPYQRPQLDTARHIQAFADLCLRAYHATERSPRRRIYISRRHADHWRTTNEAEVAALLERYGFESYELEGLTFQQQVALFAEAEIIVGAGSGVSNVIFAPPSAQVLHIQDPTHLGGAFYPLCCAQEQPYWYFFGDPVPNPESRYGVADLHVPLDRLRQSLEQMLACHTT